MTDDIERPCPACGGQTKNYEIGQKAGFHLLRCRNCQTLYTSRLPEVARAEDYDQYYGTHNLEVPAFIHHRLDEIIGSFSSYKQRGNLLDIGFGAGSLLQAATRAGWQVEGVEVSRSAVEHVKRQGYNVFCGDLAEANYPSNFFDVVTASEVIEHVPEPLALVKEITRVLRPQGLLWATTPHSNGISARILGLDWSVVSPPEHLQLFSERGIKTLFKAAGFNRVSVATQGANPFEVLHAFKNSSHQQAARIETNGEKGEVAPPSFNRVETGCQLNEMLSSGILRRQLKEVANKVLRITRLGDSLKIWAEK